MITRSYNDQNHAFQVGYFSLYSLGRFGTAKKHECYRNASSFAINFFSLYLFLCHVLALEKVVNMKRL